MSENSKIEWTHHTFNCWWGCTKVSDGCKNCYALRDSKRYGFDIWGPTADRRFFGDKHWNEPIAWNRKAEREGERRRVFCASMSDVFEYHDDVNIGSRMDIERLRLWKLIDATPMLDWLILSKRPENMRAMLPAAWRVAPRPNVWLGTSAEDQANADQRIPHLLAVPAAVHFLSAEPLLGPLDIVRWMPPTGYTLGNPNSYEQAIAQSPMVEKCDGGAWFPSFESASAAIEDGNLPRAWFPDATLPAKVYALHGNAGHERHAAETVSGAESLLGPARLGPVLPAWIDWVIVGGESGHGARPMHPQWARDIREQCVDAKVAYHFKQWGEHAPHYPGDAWEPSATTQYRYLDDPGIKVWRIGKKPAGRILDGRTWDEFPKAVGVAL